MDTNVRIRIVWRVTKKPLLFEEIYSTGSNSVSRSKDWFMTPIKSWYQLEKWLRFVILYERTGQRLEKNFPKRVIQRFSTERRERMKSAEHAEGPRGGPIPVERGIGKKYIDPMTGVRGIFNKRFPSNDEDLINPSAGIKPGTARLGSIGARLILMTPFNPLAGYRAYSTDIRNDSGARHE